jgi:hypothetical protein
VVPNGVRMTESNGEAGQAALLLLGVLAALLAGVMVLFGLGRPSMRGASISGRRIWRPSRRLR